VEGVTNSLSLAMLDSSLGEGAYRGPLAVEGVSLPREAAASPHRKLPGGSAADG